MKTNLFRYGAVAALSIALAAGCALFGANPKPPTPTEEKLFNVVTNIVPQVVVVTNTVMQTNIVDVTPPGAPAPVQVTNVVTETHVFNVTNQVAQYQYSPKPENVQTVQSLGTATAPFTAGIGTIVSAAILALYSGWATMRSSKNANTSTALAQEIETIREFILTLPSGAKIDQAVTQFMQQHQVEAGVANQVLSIIGNSVSNNDAKVAAQELQTVISTLAPPTPKT